MINVNFTKSLCVSTYILLTAISRRIILSDFEINRLFIHFTFCDSSKEETDLFSYFVIMMVPILVDAYIVWPRKGDTATLSNRCATIRYR